MEPLQDGQTAVIIGGGPGGTACGLALLKLAQSLGRQIRIVLYDGKAFTGGTHYNQCAGVFSPPIEQFLTQIGIPFPHHLVQRQLHSYILHSERRQIRLTSPNETSYALRRVQFDAYMLKQAQEQGCLISAAPGRRLIPNKQEAGGVAPIIFNTFYHNLQLICFNSQRTGDCGN